MAESARQKRIRELGVSTSSSSTAVSSRDKRKQEPGVTTSTGMSSREKRKRELGLVADAEKPASAGNMLRASTIMEPIDFKSAVDRLPKVDPFVSNFKASAERLVEEAPEKVSKWNIPKRIDNWVTSNYDDYVEENMKEHPGWDPNRISVAPVDMQTGEVKDNLATKAWDALYMPGGGLTNLTTMTNALAPRVGLNAGRLAESQVAQKTLGGVNKLLNTQGINISGQLASKMAQMGAVESVIGVPLGGAYGLKQGKDMKEVAKEALLGGVAGGLVGGGLPLAGAGLKSLVGKKPLPIPEEPLQQPAQREVSNPMQEIDETPFSQENQAMYPKSFNESYGNNIQTWLKNNPQSEEVIQPVEPSKVTRIADLKADTPIRGTRANYANQLNNGNLSDDLQESIRNTDQSYEVKNNQAAVDTADEALKDVSQATNKFLLNESGGDEHIALGYKLMKRLGDTGKHEEALIVSRKLAADLTSAGQTVQAASILSRLSPEGQLLNLVKQAEKNGMEVTVADSIKFKELAAKVQENSGAGIRANQFNEILNRMEKGENVSVTDIKTLSDYLTGAEKVVKPKVAKSSDVADDLPTEFKDTKKRDKIISYLDDAEQAALARIAARKNRLNALPLDEWTDHAIVVSSQIAKGSIKAATHVEDLVKMFGEEIRPYANQVFQKAQELSKVVSRRIGRNDIDKANEALRRATGQSDADKAVVEETARHVKKLIEDAKAGNLDPADIQKLRDYADEIADMTKDAIRKLPTQEEKFLQSVKALAKKIAQVESEKIPTDQANREVSSLLRQIVKISDEGTPKLKGQPIDNKALSDIAHDVMEKTRPAPKPTTLQEKIVEKYLKENPKVSEKDIDTLRNLAKNITRLSSDARVDADIAMQKILNSYEKSSAWDKVQSLRYIGMLLNTATQSVNALSGPIMATTGAVADVFGTMLDVAVSTALKTPRTTTIYGNNPLKFLARYMKGLKVGAKAGFQGVNPAGIQSTNEIRGLAFPGKYNPLGWAERTLGAVSKGADYAAYKSVFDAEMEKQGFLSAKNKGIKGKDNIQKHIQEFINDPPETAILQADRIGKNTTFQRSDTTGGKIAGWLNQSPNIGKPLINTMFPFVRTPVNIASTAVTMTPAGIIKGLFQLTSSSKASQREAIRTLSLGVTGTGLSAVGFYLFNLGIITGANDSGNKDVDSIHEQAGKGKYRFNQSASLRYLGALMSGDGSDAAEKAAQYRKGDQTFDYNKLQPLAFPLAIGAGIAANKDKGASKALQGAGTDAYGSLYGMSTLKGVQNLFQPSYGGTIGEKALGFPYRVAEGFFKSFSSGGLAQEARRQDPIQRVTPYNDGPVENTTEYFKSRIPGLSQKLPARKTTLGQDYKNPEGFKGTYLNPYRSEVAPYNEAAEIISGLIDRTGDMKLAPSAPLKYVKGTNKSGVYVTIDIPKERYAELQEDVGNEIIKRILALPEYTDDKLAEKIEEIYTDVRKVKMNEVKIELGIIVK